MLIDKPLDWTSHDVVAVVRRQLGTRAVGHAGTLDPFATGLLLVLFGKATRLARFVEGLAKRYRAVIRLGVATDTDDATGTPTETVAVDVWPDDEAMQHVVASFIGRYAQRPPAYSAKHVAGTRSHVLARRGEAVTLPDVDVMIHELVVRRWTPPDLEIDAVVGRGTYLRALARDVGARLGIPAHCATLRRMAIGPFSVEDAAAPTNVAAASVLSMAALLPQLPAVTVGPAAAREIGFGRPVAEPSGLTGTAALLAEDGHLLAVADGRDGWWHPMLVLEPAS